MFRILYYLLICGFDNNNEVLSLEVTHKQILSLLEKKTNFKLVSIN